ADLLGVGIVLVDEVAQALGEVQARSTVGHFCVSPGSVRVDEHEDVGSAVTYVLVVVAASLPWFGLHRDAFLGDELSWRFVEADDRASRIWQLGIKRQDVFHSGDEFRIDLGNAPHLLLPGLELHLAKRPPNGFFGDLGVYCQLNHLIGEYPQGPARAPRWGLGAGKGTENRFVLHV